MGNGFELKKKKKVLAKKKSNMAYHGGVPVDIMKGPRGLRPPGVASQKKVFSMTGVMIRDGTQLMGSFIIGGPSINQLKC